MIKLIQKKGALILASIFLLLSSFDSADKTLYKIDVDGKLGFIDNKGNEVIKPQYLFVSDFSEGLAVVVIDTTIIKSESFFSRDSITYRYGYINTKNKRVLDANYLYTEAFDDNVKESLANRSITFRNLQFFNDRAVYQDKNNNKFGFINKKGEVVINPIYYGAQRFSESLAAVDFVGWEPGTDREHKWGYININGEIVIEGKYTFAKDFYDDRAIVFIADYGDESLPFEERLINHYFLVIDKSGHIIGSPFNTILNIIYGDFREGYCMVQQLDMFDRDYLAYKFIDKNGEYTTDFEMEEVTSFSNGYAGVKTEDGWVFVDPSFNIVSNEYYDDVYSFSEGYAAVKKGRKWGYIDTTFAQVIPYRFDEGGHFKNSLVPYKIKTQSLSITGYIDKKGEIVWQHQSFEYD